MAYKREVAPVLLALGLAACGAAAVAAWRHGFWGLLTGAFLAAIWLGAVNWWAVVSPRSIGQPAAHAASADAEFNPVLLDAAPTPMLAIKGEYARVLNRAARRLFATDDRVLPVPAGLTDPHASHVRHEGRSWRVDRVALTGPGEARTVAALIDIEQEERAAEARATAEMIHVLGHELLNGLAPIVSLAESGAAALDQPDIDAGLLREILGTLARRSEGLLRFTEAYRSLARLPEPLLRPVPLSQLADDLSRLFTGRWPQIALSVAVETGPDWPLDRDQISQAVWALLQNAAEAAFGGSDDARVALAMRYTEAGLALEVEDNGCGVPPDSSIQIFRPFHSTKSGGTGVGLSLARQIANAHGGVLNFEAGRPTIFRLLLPWR